MTGVELARLIARVDGRVQGVGFRYFVQDRATTLGLSGRVRNLATGAVEVEAEGPRDRLEHLLRDVERGPSAARVTRVESSWRPPRGIVGFRVEATR